MNISYNKTNQANQSSSAVSGGNFISVLAMIAAVVYTVVTSRVFRAVAVVLCFIGAVIIVGLAETGSISFGKAVFMALLLGIIEVLCLRERRDS